MARITGRSSAEPFSTWEISRASDLASPSRAAATSAEARESAGTLLGRPRHREQQGIALAAPTAQRRRAESAAPPPELVDQVQGQSGPAHPDRVAERDGAAIHVDDVRSDPEVAHRLDCHSGECLVDLNQIQIFNGPPGLGQRMLDGPRWL